VLQLAVESKVKFPHISRKNVNMQVLISESIAINALAAGSIALGYKISE
jgi:hypothetical protein